MPKHRTFSTIPKQRAQSQHRNRESSSADRPKKLILAQLRSLWQTYLKTPHDDARKFADLAASVRRRSVPAKLIYIGDVHLATIEQMWTGGFSTQQQSLYGPPRHQTQRYNALKAILSEVVLICENVAGDRREYTTLVCEILKNALRSGFPADRQVVSAVLHHVRSSFTADHIVETVGSVLPRLWQEWTIMREGSPSAKLDPIILVGFLQATSDYTAAESCPQWSTEALELAKRYLLEETVTEQHLGTVRGQLAGTIDSSHSRLLQATATAAVNIRDYHSVLSILSEGKLPQSSVLKVLGHAATIAETLQNSVWRSSHLVFLEDMVVSLTSHNRHFFAVIDNAGLHHHVMPIASLLIRKRQYALARDILCASRSVDKFPAEPLLQCLNAFVRHRVPSYAYRLYSSITPESRTPEHYAALLRADASTVSNAVWQDFIVRKMRRPPYQILLGRLLHHLKSRRGTLAAAIRDYQAGISTLGFERHPRFDAMLGHLYLRFKQREKAMLILEQSKLPPRLRSHLANSLLATSGLPKRRHYRPRGLLYQSSAFDVELRKLSAAKHLVPSDATANIMLQAATRWGELDNEAVWQALHAALQDAEHKSWQTYLRPLFRIIISAFARRGAREDAKKAVVMMAQYRDQYLANLASRSQPSNTSPRRTL